MARAEASSGDRPRGVVVFEALNDGRVFDGLRGDFHFDPVAHRELYKILAELARDVGEHLVTIEYLHPKHSAGQNGYDFSFDFYGI